MLIVLASLGLIRRHRPLNVATSTNRHVRTAPPPSAAPMPRHCHLPTPKERHHSNAFYCCLLVPMLIVLASLRLIQCHCPIYAENIANTSMGMVQFQYWASTGAHTGIGTAAMEFISSTGTWQVPVPVLAWLFAAQTSEFSIVLWKNCDKKENTSEFEYGYQYRYCAAPYQCNLCVWVPTYRTITTVSSTIGFRIFLGYSFGQARDIPKLLADI